MKNASASKVVYVIDDDEAMRDSLALLLNASGFKVCCYENAERFLFALSASDPQTICCALLDINLDGMSGMELQEILLSRQLNIPIAFITGAGEISSAVNALKKGAIDFLQKPIKEDMLCTLVSTMLKKAQLDHDRHIDLDELNEKFKLLSKREVQVLERIAAGRINKQVATDLNISVKTVEAHRANIMSKLQANRPANLLEKVIKHQEAKALGLI